MTRGGGLRADPERWGPDPERAQQLAVPLLEHFAADDRARAPIEHLCAHAPFLAARLRAAPHWLEEALQSDLDRPVDRDALDAALRAQLRGAEDAAAILRRFKYKTLLRITLRELDETRVPLAAAEHVLEELSELANALLDAALEVASAALRERWGPPRFGDRDVSLCVLGLGKLGAGELNYSSDVDLIYVFSEIDPAATDDQGRTPGEYFARLARDLGALVTENNDEGFLYRVDLDLRPEGSAGPIALSENALAAYYEARADAWERAAFAKARPVAGDLELGWRAIRSVHPSIFRSTMDLSTVRGIRELKERVVAERGGRDDRFDVKRDPGGIRDIEFVAQAHQLLHGGRIPQLRDPGTLGALERLEGVGLLAPSEVAPLVAAYRFLRRLEHRLQMRDERQVHALETDAAGLSFWGAAMGLPADAFRDRLSEHRAVAEAAAQRILPEDRSEAVLELFVRHQSHLVAQPQTRSMMEQLAADWARAIADSADPELAFNNLDRFVEGLGGRRFYYELLLDRPELVGRLCALFASSRFLSNLLAQYPRLIEPVFGDPAKLLLSRDELRVDLVALRRDTEGEDASFEEALRTLRLFVHRHTLNIGLLDVGGAVGRAAVEGALSDLAQVTLEAALESAERELARRRPPALDDATLLVVAMGKFGSRELSYGSDLDLIFLYDPGRPDPATLAEAQDFFVRLVQRLISALQTQTGEGRCYEIDARLRPSGGQGALVCSLDAFARYHASESQTWERQALLRARAVAGDPTLGERFEAQRRTILSSPPETDLATQIHHLRERMEQELAREVRGRRDFKTGRGGILDVESAVQYLQLLHGGAHPELFEPVRLEDHIARLAELGALAAPHARALGEGFAFLQQLSSVLRIAENRSISDLDTERGDLNRLGRRMGYRPELRERDARRSLLRDYEQHTEAIRGAYLEIVRPS